MKEQHLLENINNKSNFQLFAFSFLCFIAFTYNLGEVPPYHADENFYVTSSRNMIDSGDYITPMYHGEKRFAKPILFYWLVSTSYKAFGINLFSARLVSSFFGALCIPIVYIVARRLFDHKTAIISALLLPGCYLHFQIARWAITDMALNFFILSTFYFFIRGFQDKKNKSTSYCLMYICMGIGFMIKGPPSIIIPTLVIGCFIFMSQNREEFRQLKFLYGLVILLVIIFPWFAKMLKMHGDEFKNHILGAEIRDRVIHNTPFSLYYFGVVARYYLPWSFFFIAALANKFESTPTPSLSMHSKENYFSSAIEKLKIWCKNMTLKNNQGFLFSILWIAWPLIVFTLFRIEHSRYMLPISAPIVMITAQFLSQFIYSPNRFQDRVFKISFYLTMVFYLLIIILVAAGVVLLTSHFKAPTELIVLSILCLLGLVAILVFYKFEKKIYKKEIWSTLVNK